MAGPLTWQDVAGQVRVSNYADTSALITQGIAGVGDAVAKLGGAKDERRKADLASKMLVLDMQAEAQQKQAALGNQLSKDLEARDEKKAAKEFGAAQSTLETLAREAALSGKSYNDFLQSDAYLNLSEGARAYGAGQLSDAFVRGDESRMQREERDADNRRQAAQWGASFRLQQESAEAARADRLEAKKDRDAARAEAALSKPKVWATGDDKTDKAMAELARRTGTEWNEASGAAYADVDLTSLGKKYQNLGAVSDIFGVINNRRVREQGKEPLPLNVLKRIVDTAVGSENDLTDGLNDIDDEAITNALIAAERQYDNAAAGRDYYTILGGKVDAGLRLDQKNVDTGWNRLFQPQREAEARQKAEEQAQADQVRRDLERNMYRR